MRTVFAYFFVVLLMANLFLALSVAYISYTPHELKYMENFMWFTAMCWLLWGIKGQP